MDTIPMCFCGNGKMEVRCAGESAKNPGRYYYKCPLGNKHTRSFIWCDEYVEEDLQGKGDNPFISTATSIHTPDIGHHYINETTPEIRHHYIKETTPDSVYIVCGLIKKQLEVMGILVFGFMAIVFVLFGILIGKMY